jgi:hypothetical protein
MEGRVKAGGGELSLTSAEQKLSRCSLQSSPGSPVSGKLYRGYRNLATKNTKSLKLMQVLWLLSDNKKGVRSRAKPVLSCEHLTYNYFPVIHGFGRRQSMLLVPLLRK